MKSKKTHYVAGPDGLQARRTAAIETHLRLVIENGRSLIDASQRAAESRGFATKWGGRQVCKWTHHYIQMQLLAQDEMTAQANDIMPKTWVFEDQHRLRKKGVGHGLHKSDILCSTVGWLEEATQTLEYGKNYEGYWTGELFVKQLKDKIIPTFKCMHGAGHQALIMVNNSQGHSAYSEDALLVSRMNVNPGGKQA
ncbi:hypothetical protein L208DRAFT_1277353 [Tricholoma matsutake]|nr:hypothetical protein L208DRAFT_1277353 [Tricholoma matsutake 945]